MSTLYHVRVLAFEATALHLRVRITHPDVRDLEPTRTFAFNLLASALDETDRPAPLHDEIDPRALFDEPWVRDHASEFVAAVSLDDPHRLPPPTFRDDAQHDAFWSGSSDDLPAATLQLTLTHPAWGEHLALGQAWDTAAYDMGPAHDAAPRAPGDWTWTLSDDPHAGTSPADHADGPDACDLNSLREHGLPTDLRLPTLDPHQYARLDPQPEPGPEAIDAALGHPSWIDLEWDSLLGTLARDPRGCLQLVVPTFFHRVDKQRQRTVAYLGAVEVIPLEPVEIQVLAQARHRTRTRVT